MIFLDQRGKQILSSEFCNRFLTFSFWEGTGLSSTITARTLATEGDPAKQAALLKNFRADSIGTFLD